MSKYIEQVTESLKSVIKEVTDDPSPYLKNPKKDFSRNRKINLKTLIGITMNSGGGTMNRELLDYFDFATDTPTVSAYSQQRAKISPAAFEHMFRTFTQRNMPSGNEYEGYRLIACDGSKLSIAGNPNDLETLWHNYKYRGSSNMLHLNAFYDLLNRIYVDIVVQPASVYNEHRACLEMMERSPFENVILIADRGYESFNLIAHAINKGWKFVIRVKDIHGKSISSRLQLPPDGPSDRDISLKLTRRYVNESVHVFHRYLKSNRIFNFLPPDSDEIYVLPFRIARFSIGEGSYETVVTNLDRTTFPVEKLREIYGLRWGIETSFRELKYAIGLTSFHAKKVDYIKQEIYARLLMYNYCELITTHVIKQMKKKYKTKQVNFTMAICICREYFRQKRSLSPPDVIKLIEKNILPVRPNRKDPRKVRPQASVSFLYRVA